jgi:ribosomal protein L11 methyltransferase
MFSLEIDCAPDEREFLIAELWERGVAGVAELTPVRVRAFFEDGADRRALLAAYPGSALREEEDRDWVAEARDKLQPMEVGERFFLVPEWRDDPTPAGRFRIAVNPGMAFGTGVHETTRLCIEALERHLRTGMDVLDVGTGSGILAQAAALLGARRVYACDTDPIAVEIAGLGFVGSADAVKSAAADIVVANISPEAIAALAPDLRRACRPGGIVLASGFELPEIDQVRAVLGKRTELHTKGNWALAEARETAGRATPAGGSEDGQTDGGTGPG